MSSKVLSSYLSVDQVFILPSGSDTYLTSLLSIFQHALHHPLPHETKPKNLNFQIPISHFFTNSPSNKPSQTTFLIPEPKQSSHSNHSSQSCKPDSFALKIPVQKMPRPGKSSTAPEHLFLHCFSSPQNCRRLPSSIYATQARRNMR